MSCNDSVRSIKDYERKTIATAKFKRDAHDEIKVSNEISFTDDDTNGVAMPHNDPLVIEIQVIALEYWLTREARSTSFSKQPSPRWDWKDTSSNQKLDH